MRQSQNLVGQTLNSVQLFLDTNAAIIGPGLEVVRGTLDVAAGNIAAHFVQQDTADRNALGATQKVRALKVGLRFDHMRPIAEIARRKLASVPEFKALSLPPFHITTTRLITAAQAMAHAAEPYTATFIGVGLAPDFIARVLAAVDELTQTLATRKQHVASQVGATAGLSAEAREARSIVRLLDSLVRPRIRSNPVLYANWIAATRFRRAARNAVPALGEAAAATAKPAAPIPTVPAVVSSWSTLTPMVTR